jgi:acyl transferase domain-containing protein
MATRGSIPKMMELAGIDMLPPEAGIPLIRRELTAGGTRGEIVIGKRLGILLKEWDSTGGLDAKATQSDAEKQRSVYGPMIGAIAGMSLAHGVTIETTLDPKVQPFLHDHQIDGTPVLPGVMGIEAFAEAAQRMLPGWHVAALEDVNFFAPFKFYRNEPRTLTIQAVFHPEGNEVVANCRLLGSRLLPNQAEPQVTTHFSARVRLAKQAPETLTGPAPGGPPTSITAAADIYRIYFHGPAYQVLARAWREEECIIGQFAEDLPRHHYPTEQPMLMAPRLIELCFQTAGLWELSAQGHMGLPQHIQKVCLQRSPNGADGSFYAVVTPNSEQGSFDAEVLDEAGNRYFRLIGYRTVALPNIVDTEPLKALQAVAA